MSQDFLSWKDVITIPLIIGGFIFGGAILVGLGINSIAPNNQNVRFISIIASIVWMTISPFTIKKLERILFTSGEDR